MGQAPCFGQCSHISPGNSPGSTVTPSSIIIHGFYSKGKVGGSKIVVLISIYIYIYDRLTGYGWWVVPSGVIGLVPVFHLSK